MVRGVNNRVKLGLQMFLAAVLILSALPAPLFATNAASPWFASDPILGDSQELPAGNAPPYSLNGNIDCLQRKIITRPHLILSEQTRDGCVIDTAFGAYDKAGFLQRPGTTVSGLISSKYGGTTTLAAIPHSADALVNTGYSGYGVYYAFLDNLGSHLHSLAALDGTVSHTFDADTPATRIADASGQAISITYDSLSYSSNGDWFIADADTVGFIRVNTKTHEVLPFGDRTNYANALAPGFQSAISPDGRYAVVASNTYSRFKLYDLATCGAVPAHITTKVSCQSKDLYSFMAQKVPGFFAVSNLRFRGDYGIDLYTAYIKNGVVRRGHTNIVAAGQSITGFDYLGLGDSFAAGEGAYEYKAATDTVVNKCHLSQRSYPYLIAEKLSLSQYDSVACSGAVIKDINSDNPGYTGQVHDNKKLQDRDTKALLAGLLPGYLPQLSFIKDRLPSVITVSAVGNDIGFADIIKRCVSVDMCYGYYEERVDLLKSIDAQFDRLTNMYGDLVNASAPNTRIYAIGYPQVADPDGNCADNVHLTHEELQFANDLTDYLNTMIERAAKRAGVYYVDTSNALVGHRLCETNSWEVAVNGLTAGKDTRLFHIAPLPIGNESYHPNAFGQDLLKTAILSKTNNMTVAMPEAQPSITQPLPDNNLGILKNAPKSYDKQRYRILASTMGEDVAYANQSWNGTTGADVPLAPNTSAEVWAHSTPTKLGTFTTTLSGDLSFSVTVPSSLEPGFHTMHIYAKNVAGEDIDLEKVVYVAASTQDMDGDGVLNDQDSCPSVAQSGHDIDQDGIDDACDGDIGQTPLPVVPVPDQGLTKELPVHESDPWGAYIGPPAQTAVIQPEKIDTPDPNPIVIQGATNTDIPGGSANSSVLGSETIHNMKYISSVEARKRPNKKPTTYVVVGVIFVIGLLILWRSKRRV